MHLFCGKKTTFALFLRKRNEFVLRMSECERKYYIEIIFIILISFCQKKLYFKRIFLFFCQKKENIILVKNQNLIELSSVVLNPDALLF